jgi:hypothetical protein
MRHPLSTTRSVTPRAPGPTPHRSALRRLGAQASAAAGIALLAAVALLAAACGGGGGNGDGSSGGGHSTIYQKELAFSQCMRAHGQPNFPDPGSNGVIAIKSAAAPKGSPSKDQRTGGTQMTKANNICRHLLPNGGVPTAAQRQQMLQQGLKFSRCMRAHGVSNFPDPSQGGGPVTIGGTGINPQSPQFQAAQHTCQNLVAKHGGGLRIPA